MHKLTRTLPEPPALVTARRKNVSNWADFSPQEKNTVRDELLRMQNCLCAYCERSLHASDNENEVHWDGHIEHFRRKDANYHPELTFVWENLFYSCLTEETCGRSKDHYISDKSQYDLLIDPCKENPEDFFVFDINGRIAIRSNLTADQTKRAELTINAFNLNEPRLTLKRKEYFKIFKELRKNADFDIVSYLKGIEPPPFITAIYHFFGKRVVT